MSKDSKFTAALSLGVMAAGFAATLPWSGQPWVRLLQNGFEAGLVGGLADWFAVTALFRHPMGIPIPHTALLPKNRERVTQALISAVEQDLLSKQSLKNKLAGMRIAPLVLDALERQLGSERAQQAIAGVAEHLIMAIPTERAAVLIEQALLKELSTLDVRKPLAFLIEQAIARGVEEKAFDAALDIAERWVMQESTVHQMGGMAMKALGELQTNGFMQFALNAFIGFMNEEKLGGLIQRFILGSIESMKLPKDASRQAMLREIRRQLSSLPERPELREQAGDWLQAMAAQANLSGVIAGMLKRAKERLLVSIREERFAEDKLLPYLQGLLGRFRSEEAWLERAEAFIQEQLASLIETHHQKIGALIRENVDKFDNETLIALLEDKIGRDLQWIRVNGAVCGFLIGLLLAGVKYAFA